MRCQSAWNVPSSALTEKLGIHRNIPDGLSLEVGEIDAPKNISGSPLGSFLAVKARKPARLPFRRGADSHNMHDSRVAQLLGLIATKNGAPENSTFHMSNERATARK